MNERIFVAGLLVGVASFAISASACIAMEATGYGYWMPTSAAVVVSLVLAAIAGFVCGTNFE